MSTLECDWDNNTQHIQDDILKNCTETNLAVTQQTGWNVFYADQIENAIESFQKEEAH